MQQEDSDDSTHFCGRSQTRVASSSALGARRVRSTGRLHARATILTVWSLVQCPTCRSVLALLSRGLFRPRSVPQRE